MSDIVTDLADWDGEAPLLLTLPLPPNRANSRWHWRTEKKKKDLYFARCLIRNMARPDEPLSKAIIRATLYTHQTMDMDNLMARMKWPVDWLVMRGYITDDMPSVLEWRLPQQAVDRKDQRIEIELTDLGVSHE